MSDTALRALRRSLWPLSWVYGAAVRLRNAQFDRRARAVHQLGAPVISVGNLSVGGTGKTPMVMWLVERLRELGRRPGVLARGYGRAPGAELNDEGAMLATRFPDLPQVQDPDRVAGGRRLLERGDVDVVVLDDGFQHRRLHRDRDLICADARRPFADGLLLPAGDLREPRAGLRRASGVVLTRAAAVPAAERDRAAAAVRAAAGHPLEVWCADHAPRDLLARPGDEIVACGELAGRRVGLLSAIGRPASFEATVMELGADVVWSERRRDHHRFSAAELRAVAARAEADDVTLVVTEKDAPKLAELGPHWVLRIDLRFLDAAPGAAALGLEARG